MAAGSVKASPGTVPSGDGSTICTAISGASRSISLRVSGVKPPPSAIINASDSPGRDAANPCSSRAAAGAPATNLFAVRAPAERKTKAVGITCRNLTDLQKEPRQHIAGEDARRSLRKPEMRHATCSFSPPPRLRAARPILRIGSTPASTTRSPRVLRLHLHDRGSRPTWFRPLAHGRSC